MKRSITFFLVAFFACPASLLVPAQRLRQEAPTKAGFPARTTEFGRIAASSDGQGVFIQWEMNLETNNAGFVVYRFDSAGRHQVTPSLINGSAPIFGDQPIGGESYSFFDPEGRPGDIYQIESLGLDGHLRVSSTVAAEYVPELSGAAGHTADDLYRAAQKPNAKLVTNQLSLSKELGQEVRANRPAADAAQHAWVVAQPGVKIGVRREGLYRVTRSQLEAGGFNVNTDPAFWQLYREGVEHAITIGPGADYIEFYGKGIDTVESDIAMYYLVAGAAAGKRIGTKVARPNAGTVTRASYNQTFVQKERTTYVGDLLNGDLENYFGQAIVTVADTNFNFNLTGVDFDSPQATMDLRFQGFSYDNHIVRVILNGETLANATGNSRSSFTKQYSIPTSMLREGANTLQFRSLGVFTDLSYFDSVSINFARKHVAQQNQVNFYTENFRRANITGFSSANIRVFDITNPMQPVLFTNLQPVAESQSFSVMLPADRGRVMFAVENSGLLSPHSIALNDPESLKASTNAARLVIISHKNFMTQAETWANYRRGQGITVKVVEVSEIYDEFNYGVLSADSIKAFLQFTMGNWQQTPQYVLLIGDANFDSRNYQGTGYWNMVPTRIVNTLFSETGSDDFLVDFNNDGLAELAIGRIPARETQVVTTALSKVQMFEQNVQNPLLQRGALFAHDEFDAANNYDFAAMSTRLKNQLPGNTPVTLIGRGDNVPPPDTPQTLLISSINTGKYVVNYSGHGTTGAWATATFFSNNNVPQLTNANNQSIFTMLTCLNGYFLNLVNKSLAEVLLEHQNGGAVAAWASTGKTTPDVQEIMATRFFLKLGQGTIIRLGDLIKDAKNVIPGGSDVRLSWALIGDPMLKIREPQVGDRPFKGGKQ
jgi:hypothetical protein